MPVHSFLVASSSCWRCIYQTSCCVGYVNFESCLKLLAIVSLEEDEALDELESEGASISVALLKGKLVFRSTFYITFGSLF